VRKGTTSRVMVTRRLEVSFWQDDSTSPGNYAWLFVCEPEYNTLIFTNQHVEITLHFSIPLHWFV
jgi:hypothetical protein